MAIQQQLLLFLFFFSFHSICMVIPYKVFPQYISKILARSARENEKRRACLGLFKAMPSELVNNCISNLDYKSNMRLIMTCTELYKKYANRSDILFTEHYLNHSDYTGAMIHFARKGDKNKIELLIKHEGPNNEKDRIDILKFLDTPGTTNAIIDVYKTTYEKDSIYARSENGRLKQILSSCKVLCQVMWQQGYDLNARDDGGYTKLEWAISTNDSDYLKLLLSLDTCMLDRNSKRDHYTPLHCAIIWEKKEAAEILLKDAYVDVNEQDRYGYTPVCSAAKYNDIEMVQLLLTNAKVDGDIKNNLWMSAYCCAKDPAIKALLAPRTSFLNQHAIFGLLGCGCVEGVKMLTKFGCIVVAAGVTGGIGLICIKRFAPQYMLDIIIQMLKNILRILDKAVETLDKMQEALDVKS